MPNMTQAEYEALLARRTKQEPKTDDERRLASDASREEEALHEFIANDAASKLWIAIRSRMDKPTTRTPGEWDWLILADGGRKFLIECKRRGEKLSPDQRDLHHWAATLGHTVHTVWSPAQYLEVVAK